MDPLGYELFAPQGSKGGAVRPTGFKGGETVMIGELEGEVERNDSHATQISRTRWARHRGLGPMVNHPCDPNCGVEVNETGACDFIARESVAAARRSPSTTRCATTRSSISPADATAARTTVEAR